MGGGNTIFQSASTCPTTRGCYLQVVVSLPDEKGRRDILDVHMRGVPMASSEEKAEACFRLARVTSGASRCVSMVNKIITNVRFEQLHA